MSSKLKPYSWITCHKKSERRHVSGNANKSLRKFLSKTFVTDLCDSNVVCKCRQLYYTSMKSKTYVSGEFKNSEMRRENADAPRGPYACISLPIPSTGYGHDACAFCNKKPRTLVVVPEQFRNELFVHTGVLL